MQIFHSGGVKSRSVLNSLEQNSDAGSRRCSPLPKRRVSPLIGNVLCCGGIAQEGNGTIGWETNWPRRSSNHEGRYGEIKSFARLTISFPATAR